MNTMSPSVAEDRLSTQRSRGALAVVTAAVGLFGVFALGGSVAYIAGMFGLSIAFANQIVHAVEVGGWVLAIVMGLLSGGIAGVAIGTARWALAVMGRAYAAA